MAMWQWLSRTPRGFLSICSLVGVLLLTSAPQSAIGKHLGYDTVVGKPQKLIGGRRAFHSSDHILKTITSLVSTCTVPLTVTWESDKGANATKGKVFVARVGNPKALKRVMVVANEHAREMFTAEVAMSFIKRACTTGGVKPNAPSFLHVNAEGAFVKGNLFGAVQFVVVPILNVKGRQVVEDMSEPCQRLTVAEEGGVDLNRNMDVDWGKGETQPWGTHAFSTYQARILRDLAAKEKPLAYVDLHTGSKDLMTPYGYKRAIPSDFKDVKVLLDRLRDKYCPDCEIGPNSVVIRYPNPGEIIDHMYVKQKIKYTSLWEIWKGQDETDCIEYFNPPDHLLQANTDIWASALAEVGDFVRHEVGVDESASPDVIEWNSAEFVEEGVDIGVTGLLQTEGKQMTGLLAGQVLTT
eukprot:TRINITY_DN4081_c0_g1_i4.p1 TRINITY_DN4081_c0_g1~~TRINITY_DN4081_c0_g1_i4.p1  ORF type:complete len:410 (+),score=69.12 TRINITY_DN4081_c0_g1_i4:85-1314(+)